MPQITFDTFSVAAPRGWEDITDSVETEVPPPTLALGDGVGTLQFSVALYVKGPIPDPTRENLLEMVAAFGEARGLGAPRDVVVESSPLRLAAGSFAWDTDFLRVWQVSDGRNFAFVTYTCESGREIEELRDCERIVRSLQFRGVGGRG
jgi:hypothetical protein